MAPFVIFHDTTLRAMARTNPKTLAELETIPGIGPSKLERYGAAVVELLIANGAADPVNEE